MERGPTVNLARVRRSTTKPRSRSRSRSPGHSAAAPSASSLDDRETLAEKLNDAGRRLRDIAEENTLLKARLQRSETEGSKKDKTIDELLQASSGGYTDGASIRRTQQQHNSTLKDQLYHY